MQQRVRKTGQGAKMRRKLEFEEDGRGTKKASVWVGVGGEKINIEVEGGENGDGGHASIAQK